MSLYSVEIFAPDFSYRASEQIEDAKFRLDYLSLDNIKLELMNVTAEKGDYIIITGQRGTHAGIVYSCVDDETKITVEYKPMLSIADVTAHFSQEELKTKNLETWLADILNGLYRDNTDVLQNITGFSAEAETATENALLPMETNIENIYEIITAALINYGVVVDFSVDVNNKKITAKIRAKSRESPTIEADLPNILSKTFTLKQADTAVNKITIYNELNESESETFYMLADGSITTDRAAMGRITPVVFTAAYISREEDDEETFYDLAYEKAFGSLMQEKYNCLIELQVMNDDTLIHPEQMEIGQQVKIIRDGKVYSTMLTGKEIGDTTTLIFGAVRLELTKLLKRRMRK